MKDDKEREKIAQLYFPFCRNTIIHSLHIQQRGHKKGNLTQILFCRYLDRVAD